MSPATILLIVQAVQAAISAAPGVVDVVEKATAFIESLFSAGVISAEQQAAVRAHVDAVAAAVASGAVPPEFAVEPDPGTEQKTNTN